MKRSLGETEIRCLGTGHIFECEIAFKKENETTIKIIILIIIINIIIIVRRK